MGKNASPWFSGQRIVPKKEDRSSFKVLIVYSKGEHPDLVGSASQCIQALESEGFLRCNLMTTEVGLMRSNHWTAFQTYLGPGNISHSLDVGSTFAPRNTPSSYPRLLSSLF